ncbi:hypothetical protein LPJ61_004029, partial [Coemansia biformis]
ADAQADAQADALADAMGKVSIAQRPCDPSSEPQGDQNRTPQDELQAPVLAE